MKWLRNVTSAGKKEMLSFSDQKVIPSSITALSLRKVCTPCFISLPFVVSTQRDSLFASRRRSWGLMSRRMGISHLDLLARQLDNSHGPRASRSEGRRLCMLAGVIGNEERVALIPNSTCRILEIYFITMHSEFSR